MKETLLIQTKIGSEKSSRIWDDSAPVAIGKPFRWVIERTSTGVRVRDLFGGNLIGIPHDKIREGARIDLPELPGNKDHSEIFVKATRPIPPAYMTGSAIESQEEKKSLPMLFAYGGMRRSLISCTLIHSAYVAYEAGSPAFALYHSKDGFRIKTLAGGVRLKMKGEKPVTAEPGTVWEIKKEDMVRATLFRGWHWWRFSLVMAPSAVRGTITSFEDENRLFRKLAWIIGGAMFAFFALLLAFGPSTSNTALDDGPIVKLDNRKSKIFLKPVKEATVAEAPAPGAIEKKQAAAPAPAPAPVPVHSAPRSIPSSARAAREAKNIKNALGDLRALGFKGVASPKGKMPIQSPNSNIFDGPKKALAPLALNTEVKPLTSGSQVVVQGIGGRGTGGRGSSEKGLGYASSGIQGAISGQGGSFVSLGDGGYKADEGLSKEEIGAVIHGHMGEVRYCHESAMLQNPKTEGRLVLQFKIDPHGRVVSAETEQSSVTSNALEECVKTRLLTWRFPKPRGGVFVTVSYPFNFKILERE